MFSREFTSSAEDNGHKPPMRLLFSNIAGENVPFEKLCRRVFAVTRPAGPAPISISLSVMTGFEVWSVDTNDGDFLGVGIVIHYCLLVGGIINDVGRSKEAQVELRLPHTTSSILLNISLHVYLN